MSKEIGYNMLKYVERNYVKKWRTSRFLFKKFDVWSKFWKSRFLVKKMSEKQIFVQLNGFRGVWWRKITINKSIFVQKCQKKSFFGHKFRKSRFLFKIFEKIDFGSKLPKKFDFWLKMSKNFKKVDFWSKITKKLIFGKQMSKNFKKVDFCSKLLNMTTTTTTVNGWR